MPAGSVIFEDRVRVPASAFDLEGFRAWAHSSAFPESGRISYLAGEIEVDMSPEEIESHNKLKTQLLIDLGRWVQSRGDLGEFLSDGALLVNVAAELATEPDLLFSSWDAQRAGRVVFAERVVGSARFVEVTGSPDLVVEVVSQHSVRKDTVRLRERYFAAGVDEYWIVDARGGSISFALLARGPTEFVEISPDEDGYRRSEVLERSFRIVRETNPVGRAAYRVLDR